MKILFIVDARSTISQNWIENLVERGHDIHVLSSYPCAPSIISGVTIHQIPIAFAGLSRVAHNGTVASEQQPQSLSRILASLRVGALSGLSSSIRFWLSPLEVRRHANKARRLITEIAPDPVHAMRIPFEGVLAALATPDSIPLLVSIWGNDFTLFADRNPLIARQTRQTLLRADALHCDCNRDLKLATQKWGFASRKPAIVLPGAGGIQTSVFHQRKSDSPWRKKLKIPDDAPVVFNPRGFRAYVRNDAMFRAIPLILKENPSAVFVFIGMQSNPLAEKWIQQYRLADSIRLLPAVSHDEMADMFRLSDIAVSPSLHDGTPNTLIEAMACGSFPVAGDIESVREWIIDGENGLLFDPVDFESIASAIIRGLRGQDIRDKARSINRSLVFERADSKKVMLEAESFYRNIVAQSKSLATS